MISKMLSDNLVSPRTYQHKKLELEKWIQKEKDDLKKTEKSFQRGWIRALESIKRTQRGKKQCLINFLFILLD